MYVFKTNMGNWMFFLLFEAVLLMKKRFYDIFLVDHWFYCLQKLPPPPQNKTTTQKSLNEGPHSRYYYTVFLKTR